VTLRELIAHRIRARGPLTTADFMELALYHSSLGYYSRAPRRTGRAGDFFTSVDVGPQFGALLASQLDEMYRLLGDSALNGFDLVEAGAANGQLARDILDAAEADFPELYRAIRLTLVETSATARATQAETLGRHTPRLVAASDRMPDRVHGVILANELLDALPTHAVAMTPEGLREIFVDLDENRFVERTGPPSTPHLARYLERLDLRLSPGSRGEVNLAAVTWMRDAARSLTRGFMLLVDYGHPASGLYSDGHGTGTLTTFHRHQVSTPEDDADQRGGPAWLAHPGLQDITSHVDWTSVTSAAEAEGLDLLGLPDQTHFLLALGALDNPPTGSDTRSIKHRLALKTLLVPGGLGSTHHVLLLGKQVGTPTLRGGSFKTRN
jgi:SAM-dependent MidA family methyltransferase